MGLRAHSINAFSTLITAYGTANIAKSSAWQINDVLIPCIYFLLPARPLPRVVVGRRASLAARRSLYPAFRGLPSRFSGAPPSPPWWPASGARRAKRSVRIAPCRLPSLPLPALGGGHGRSGLLYGGLGACGVPQALFGRRPRSAGGGRAACAVLVYACSRLVYTCSSCALSSRCGADAAMAASASTHS